VIVRITDNGSGFDMPTPNREVTLEPSPQAGRGLRNLRQRADALGAVVQWTRLEQGSCFELRLPREALS
jgi:signal transduction histidine kinase